MRKVALILLLIVLIILIFLASGLFTRPTAAAVPWGEPPPGFSLVASAPGVELYQKDYPGGNPDFVQLVDLARGGGVQLLHAPLAKPGTGEGVYGGDNPRFARRSIKAFWEDISTGGARAFCLVNGGFFSTEADPTSLAFPLKVDGHVVSDGYALNEYPEQKLMLELWAERADITPLSEEALYASSAPDILAGLSESADKGLEDETARTFAGVGDKNGDGKFEQFLIFASKTATQTHAAGILRAFGAQKVIMLDGGGSTQLTCNSVPLIASERSIPQALAVTASTPPPLSAQVSDQPVWPILVEGERLEIEIILQNSGTETWRADRDLLVNLKNTWGVQPALPLPGDVAPYEKAVINWQTDRFQKWGVFKSEWQLVRAGQAFAGEPLQINVIVLPKSLADKKDELEAQLRAWLAAEVQDIGQMALKWIETQLESVIQKICLPQAALPLGLVIVLVSRKKRKKS